MSHDLHVLLAIAVFGAGFYLADATNRPSASQLITDAFHQVSLAPAHGSLCLPTSFNVEDRRDAIAVLIENN